VSTFCSSGDGFSGARGEKSAAFLAMHDIFLAMRECSEKTICLQNQRAQRDNAQEALLAESWQGVGRVAKGQNWQIPRSGSCQILQS
jgi:hypothetical protein